jgi:hypothetical protein
MGRAEDIYDQLVRGGEAVIDDMIARRRSEELFLDFKRSRDSGAGTTLNLNDRENLARAISGFGNSEGGVIVWGVDCSPDETGADLARASVPIENPERFVGWLEGAVSGCTIPAHPGVRHHAITTHGSAHGYVVSLIPQSERAPHQVVGRPQYLMRAGSAFLPVPHGLLAGMFGRAPHATLIQHYSANQFVVRDDIVHLGVGIIVTNAGPGLARDAFLNLNLSGPDGPSRIALSTPHGGAWIEVTAFAGVHSVITAEGIRLPPESLLHATQIACALRAPFDSDLTIRGMMGASGSPPVRFVLSSSQEQLTTWHREAVRTPGVRSSAQAAEFMGHLFGVEV